MTSIRWSPRASRDFDTIYEYLGGSSLLVAARQTDLIIQAIEQLSNFPESGHTSPIQRTRELVVPGTPYIIYYHFRKGVIELKTIRHGARRPLKRMPHG